MRKHPEGDECRNIEFKEPVADRAMKNHVIRSEEVPNEGTCRLLCYMEPNCVSINLGPLEGGKHKCELNNATDENQITMILVDKPYFTYLAIENPCSSSPCLNNGTCQAGFTSKGFRCICHAGFTGTDCSQGNKNCAEIFKSGERRDGVYTIQPDNLPAFDVFCDQTTAGGGWTVFQKRLDGSVDFFLYWNDYKHGFGNLSSEFWLGNDKIHRLTSGDKNRLRVDLGDFEENTAYAEYDTFGVMSENDKYKLILGSYSGTAGDSLAYHRGRNFTTQDQDNENLDNNRNCAERHHGAWWYKNCQRSNLNGIYHYANRSSVHGGVNWKRWKENEYSLKRTEMKIRPVDF
ncbi:microfibril-associated glycoprotein 4-like isoform X1 [Oculina patagonica]